MVYIACGGCFDCGCLFIDGDLVDYTCDCGIVWFVWVFGLLLGEKFWFLS